MNVNIIRALTGDYQNIMLFHDEVKCQGYKKNTLKLEEFLDIGHVNTLNVAKEIVLDFMRADIVSLEELKADQIFVIKRKDGKVLKFDDDVLRDNVEIQKILGFGIVRNILNIFDTASGDLKVRLAQDKVVISKRNFSYPDEVVIVGKYNGFQDKVCFTANHLELIDFNYIIDLLLRQVERHQDIQIRCSSRRGGDFLDEISFNIENKMIKMNGEVKYMLPLIIKSAEYKDELKKAKSHQLKMKGF